ncbi:pentatricopeptide repeat-containing protein At5g39350-like [Curcuma longa]|uniref:pentatricopeptide repeat-containing protein At5g39350-like n=1 Tax=Curcuma longa TaxID=136217 RepID=UPI003D9E9566
MPWQTPILSSSSLRSLLNATKSLAQIAQIHQHLAACGLSADPAVATKLLQLYADAGDLPSALRLFAVIPSPSVFAWTPILALLSRSSLHRRCLSAYRSMRSAAVAPDGYVFPLVLRSAASAHRQSRYPAAFHAEAFKFAAQAALSVTSALIDAYSKAGDLTSARRAFDVAGTRDRLSWNCIIAAHASVGLLKEALALLDCMTSYGCDPDLVTWNTLMDGYCRAGDCAEARAILYQLPRPNVISWTTVIVGYARSGNHEASLEIFSRMMHAGSIPPDLDTLSCAAASCRHVADVSAGRAVHAYGVKTNDVGAFYGSAGAALLLLYAGDSRMAAARSVFELMDPTDVVTWNAVVQGLALGGRRSAALEHFRAMMSRGVGCNHATLSSLLPLCDSKHGEEVHAHVIKHGDGGCIVTEMNALIDMYARSGCIWAAHKVFSSMDGKDVATWNTMISGFGSHGLGEQAIELVNRMVQLGFKPNAMTLTSALMACAQCGLVDEGIELFETMPQEFRFSTVEEHYACAVDMLARAGRFAEAMRLAGKMPMAARVWGAMLASCQTHQNVEFGRMAFEELVRLEPGNPGNYVTMSNIYARAGRWNDAARVRGMMEGEELMKKPSGHSWIEVA